MISGTRRVFGISAAIIALIATAMAGRGCGGEPEARGSGGTVPPAAQVARTEREGNGTAAPPSSRALCGELFRGNNPYLLGCVRAADGVSPEVMRACSAALSSARGRMGCLELRGANAGTIRACGRVHKNEKYVLGCARRFASIDPAVIEECGRSLTRDSDREGCMASSGVTVERVQQCKHLFPGAGGYLLGCLAEFDHPSRRRLKAARARSERGTEKERG